MDFDNEALIRAVVIGVAVSLLAGGILKLLLHDRENWKNKWKEAQPLVLAGFALILIVGIYYRWPSLVEVPSLDNMSLDEASSHLDRRGLIPSPEVRRSDQIESGRVIPNSQNPAAGQLVKKGRVIVYAVSLLPGDPVPVNNTIADSAQISIFEPRSRGEFPLLKSGSGLYTGEIRGTFDKLVKGRDFLVLWIRPIDPPSDKPGWYLQRHPNGIRRLGQDGSWLGSVQVGNTAWPPQGGNIIDIAVSVVDKTTHASLMSQGGEAMSMEPVGSIVKTASEVVVEIKQKYSLN